MRIVLGLIFLICFSFDGQAQFESSKRKVNISAMPDKAPKKKAILPQNTQASVPPAIKFESKIFKNSDDKFLNGLPQLPKVGELPSKTYELKNPSEIYTDKFNQKGDGEIEEKFKSDSFLGEFTTGSKTIKIACRDHEFPDGDMVRIWVNDVVVVNQITLEVDYKEIFLELKPGFNKIEFEALNQGESGPNTAQFTVVDDKGEIVTSNKWNLTTGVKAKIIVVKEDLEKK